MAKEVFFKNEFCKGFYEEKERSEDIFTLTPSVFHNELDDDAHVALCDPFGFIYVEGEDKPYYFMRHALVDMYRFGGIIELGDNPLDCQKHGDCNDFFQRGSITDTYRKRDIVDGEEFVYGFGTEEPYSSYRLYKDHAKFIEGRDILNLDVKFISDAIVDHQASFGNLPQIFLPSLWSGKYRGKNVKGIGIFAYNYQLSHKKENILSSLGYISLTVMGYRPDGKLEIAFIAIDQTGTAGAFYKKEGEPLVWSTEVSMEADWYHLPYVDDGTCVFKDAIFRFAGKEIHFTGKWGTKGISPEPRIDKHGQSHILGTWYEGNKFYSHDLSFGFSENMEAYDYKLEKLGFEVK